MDDDLIDAVYVAAGGRGAILDIGGDLYVVNPPAPPVVNHSLVAVQPHWEKVWSRDE